jgi:hypothetical protein
MHCKGGIFFGRPQNQVLRMLISSNPSIINGGTVEEVAP